MIQAVKGRNSLVGASLGELSKPTIKAPCSGSDVSARIAILNLQSQNIPVIFDSPIVL